MVSALNSGSTQTLPLPGWDASPSQGYPPAVNSPVPISTPGSTEAL